MNQNDFRALLHAKTSAGDGSSSKSSGGNAGVTFGGKRNMTASDLEEIRRLSKKPKKKGKKPGKSAASGDTDESSSKAPKSAYRDRAAERRQGIHSDMIDADEFVHLDAEQTKFLGGDLEHTHLVKGLDFALLSQLKREKEKLLHAAAAHKQQQQQVQSTSGDSSTAAAAPDKLTFKSRVGRLVYFHAVQSSAVSPLLAARATEQFLPGRMFYTFRLTGNDVASVPVIVQRSKEDCPEPDDVVSGMVSELVISKVSDALRRPRHGSDGSKKLRKKTKAGSSSSAGGDVVGRSTAEGNEEDSTASRPAATAEPDATAAIDSDDEDIFPDAGEYVPIHARDNDNQDASRTHEAPSRSKQQTGYFSNLSASLSAAEQAEKEREEAAEQAWKQTIRKVVATQSRAEREQQARLAERTKASVDEYSECYPEYQASASALDSEDDEEAPRRGAGRDKGDSDDETEKTRRRKQKQGNKLQNDLEKINQLMDAKKKSSASE